MFSQVFVCPWAGFFPIPLPLTRCRPPTQGRPPGCRHPPGYGQQAGGTHPTEMHVCQCVALNRRMSETFLQQEGFSVEGQMFPC